MATDASQITYDGVLESRDTSGEVKLTIGPDALSYATLFGQQAIPYAKIARFEVVNHKVLI